MKTIVLACGSGIATSTAVAKKVSDLLDENGYAGQYKIVQCAIAEAKANCEKGADLLIATTAPLIGHFLALTHTKVTNITFFVILAIVAALTLYNICL